MIRGTNLSNNNLPGSTNSASEPNFETLRAAAKEQFDKAKPTNLRELCGYLGVESLSHTQILKLLHFIDYIYNKSLDLDQNQACIFYCHEEFEIPEANAKKFILLCQHSNSVSSFFGFSYSASAKAIRTILIDNLYDSAKYIQHPQNTLDNAYTKALELAFDTNITDHELLRSHLFISYVNKLPGFIDLNGKLNYLQLKNKYNEARKLKIDFQIPDTITDKQHYEAFDRFGTEIKKEIASMTRSRQFTEAEMIPKQTEIIKKYAILIIEEKQLDKALKKYPYPVQKQLKMELQNCRELQTEVNTMCKESLKAGTLNGNERYTWVNENIPKIPPIFANYIVSINDKIEKTQNSIIAIENSKNRNLPDEIKAICKESLKAGKWTSPLANKTPVEI